ncbi:hypothetical protein LCGC14_1328400 [marine sediment metagenome]|uniref:Uncharacterized protein n=1 Tax=marine sediment metagenome TaxID=412755 RepID=A0A0F9KHF0_9ZZZZ
MPEEITVREAVQILSGVSQQLRSAKRLEEALKVGLAIEETVKTKTSEKDVLEVQISELHTRLSELEDEVEKEEKRVKVSLDVSSALVSAAQEKARNAEIETEAVMKGFEATSANLLRELAASTEERQVELNNKIIEREEYLKTVTDKIEAANAELASIKERLG